MNLNQCPAHRAQNYLSSLCVRRKKDNMSQEELEKTDNTETKETYQDIKMMPRKILMFFPTLLPEIIMKNLMTGTKIISPLLLHSLFAELQD